MRGTQGVKTQVRGPEQMLGESACFPIPVCSLSQGFPEIAQWTHLSLESNGKVLKPFWVRLRAGFSLRGTAFEKVNLNA